MPHAQKFLDAANPKVVPEPVKAVKAPKVTKVVEPVKPAKPETTANIKPTRAKFVPKVIEPEPELETEDEEEENTPSEIEDQQETGSDNE